MIISGAVSPDHGRRSIERTTTHGVTSTKAKRKPVLSQLIALSDTWKKRDAVVDTAEKVNHFLARSAIKAGTRGAGCSYIPADDDVQQNELEQTKETSLVDSVSNMLVVMNMVNFVCSNMLGRGDIRVQRGHLGLVFVFACEVVGCRLVVMLHCAKS